MAAKKDKGAAQDAALAVSEGDVAQVAAAAAEGVPKRPAGRPPTYDKVLIEEICSRLSSGEPLRQICRDENMPAWTTVYSWVNADKSIAERFARARELGEDALSQECLEIADDASNDWMEKLDKEGESIGWQLNGDHVQRSKLRIETRLKLLAKWNPKKWGDKVQQELTGPNGGPIDHSISVTFVKPAGGGPND